MKRGKFLEIFILLMTSNSFKLFLSLFLFPHLRRTQKSTSFYRSRCRDSLCSLVNIETNWTQYQKFIFDNSSSLIWIDVTCCIAFLWLQWTWRHNLNNVTSKIPNHRTKIENVTVFPFLFFNKYLSYKKKIIHTDFIPIHR